MTHSWEQLVGVVLAGQWDLQELLGEDERGAFYRATCNGSRAVIQILQEKRAEFWQRASQLDHPNLQRILDSGTVDGLTYVVFEFPDDRLSSTAGNQPSRAEAREILSALRSALAYLHERGFAHGAVTTDHIVAVGNTIKLETDTVHDGSASERADDLDQLEELATALGVSKATNRQWMIVGASVLAVAAFVGLTHRSATPPPKPAAYVAPVLQTAPDPTTPAAPTASPKPAVPAPAATGNWRVIAYTYLRYQDAAHKAGTINQKHPDLQAEVFTPGGANHPPFLVSLGGRMTRVEAEQLEKKAKARGLPRDTFARNYRN